MKDPVRVTVELANGSIEFGAETDDQADQFAGWLAPHVPDGARWHRHYADDPQPGDKPVEDPAS